MDRAWHEVSAAWALPAHPQCNIQSACLQTCPRVVHMCWCHATLPHTPLPLRSLLTLPDYTLSSGLQFQDHEVDRSSWKPGTSWGLSSSPQTPAILGDLSACQALRQRLSFLLQKLFLQPSSECPSPDSFLFHSHFPVNFFLSLAMQATCKSTQRISREERRLSVPGEAKGHFSKPFMWSHPE